MTDPHTQGGPIEVATRPGDIALPVGERLDLIGRVADIAIDRGLPAVFAGLNTYGEPIICTTHGCCTPTPGRSVAFPDVLIVELVANGDTFQPGAYAVTRPDGRVAYVFDVPADGA